MLQPLATLCFASLAALAVVGCENKNDNASSAQVATDQRLTGATVHRAAPGEQHAAGVQHGAPAEVIRFSDETTLAPTPATLRTPTTRVRKSPGGEPILLLGAGTEVTEIARARDHYLIQFADPHNASVRMIGWIYKDSVEAWGPPDEIASTGSRAPACAKGNIHVQADHDFCARPCREDGDCQGAGVCDGEARLFGATHSERARYCVRGDTTSW